MAYEFKLQVNEHPWFPNVEAEQLEKGNYEKGFLLQSPCFFLIVSEVTAYHLGKCAVLCNFCAFIETAE